MAPIFRILWLPYYETSAVLPETRLIASNRFGSFRAQRLFGRL